MRNFTPWYARAACANHPDLDPDLWTDQPAPVHGGKIGQWGAGEQKKAIAICRACPVMVECLNAALREEHGVVGKARYGIRGGLTPSQRAKVDAERARRGLVA